jgi:two-component system response regulator HydG
MGPESITKPESPDPCESIIGSSPAIRYLLKTIREVARTDSTVLITGECGSGKGLAARTIHAASDRRHGPFVTVNCAVYSREQLHCELFGEEQAPPASDHLVTKGRLELASGGTVFLNEIERLPPETQSRLLRLLEEGTYERVGGETSESADVRLIAATDSDLEHNVADGTFRSDLYYRLNVIPIHMPPLREHTDDLAPLIRHFLDRYADRHGRPVHTFCPSVLDRMIAYRWPGNVRELENVVERTVILCRSGKITVDDLPDALHGTARSGLGAGRGTLEEIEAARIVEALREAKGNKKQAARKLGIHRSTLYKKIERLGLDRVLSRRGA